MITTYCLCSDCYNFKYFDEGITTCEIGRVTEFREAGGLTNCEYWESRKKEL